MKIKKSKSPGDLYIEDNAHHTLTDVAKGNDKDQRYLGV